MRSDTPMPLDAPPACAHRWCATSSRARQHPRRISRTARSVQLLLGLLGVGIGVGLLVRAELGVASWDVLHVGLAERTGASVGQIAAGAGVGATVLALVLGERPRLGSLVPLAVVGPAIDATMGAVGPANAPAGRAALLLAGVAVMAVGVGASVTSDHGAGPSDLVFLGVARRGLPVWGARLLVDGVVVLGGWAIGGPVGVGTVVVTLLLGPLVAQALRLFDLEPARARQRDRDVQWRRHEDEQLQQQLVAELSCRGGHRLANIAGQPV